MRVASECTVPAFGSASVASTWRPPRTAKLTLLSLKAWMMAGIRWGLQKYLVKKSALGANVWPLVKTVLNENTPKPTTKRPCKHLQRLLQMLEGVRVLPGQTLWLPLIFNRFVLEMSKMWKNCSLQFPRAQSIILWRLLLSNRQSEPQKLVIYNDKWTTAANLSSWEKQMFDIFAWKMTQTITAGS